MRTALFGLTLVGCGGPPDTDLPPVERLWYADADGDGFGDPNRPTRAVTAPEGAIADGTDCDDGRADVYPGAVESCDGVDQDCDSVIDESGAVDEVPWWLDADGDGFGDPNQPSLLACKYGGRIDNDDDCDDTRDDVNPDGEEVCDALDADEDCDGLADDADDIVDARTRTLWYADADADGYGDPARPRWACDLPTGHQADARDCDDEDPAIFPGAPERCNGVDDDCEPTTPAMDPGTVVRVASDFTFHDVTLEWSGTADAPAAVATDPGTYWVCDGTWYVTIDAALDVAITGPGGSARTVLDGGGAGTVLTVDVADVTLSGVTLRNGEGDNDLTGSGSDGGAVACLGGSFSATDVVFSDNHARFGGAVAAAAFCEVTLEDSVFLDNTADTYGGAVYGDQITLTVSGTDFLGGAATRGGGVYMEEALAAVNLDDCLFQENAAVDGAALYLYRGLFACTGSTTTVAGFYANDASSGAAVTLASASAASFEAKTCDFGVEGSADDNSADVRVLGTNFSYDDDVSFVCDRSGCK